MNAAMNRNVNGGSRCRESKNDPELQPYLARDGMDCLDELLDNCAPGTTISAGKLGAIVKLILQAQSTPQEGSIHGQS